MIYRVMFSLSFKELADAADALTAAMGRAAMAKSGIKQDQQHGSESTEFGIVGIDGGWRVGSSFFFEDGEGFDAETYAHETHDILTAKLVSCLPNTETRISRVKSHICHNNINKGCVGLDW